MQHHSFFRNLSPLVSNSPYAWWHQSSWITTKPHFENANFKFYRELKFPKQQSWKEYPCENNTKAKKVWKNVAQTRIGGEFWVCCVIAYKAYWACQEPLGEGIDSVKGVLYWEEPLRGTKILFCVINWHLHSF